MNILAVTLPMPPSLSALTNNMPGVGRIKSKPYKAWQQGASAILRAAWKAQGAPKFSKHLTITYHLGMDYRGDIANREKALTDLLVQTIPDFPDDRWIDRIEIERVPGVDGARIMVQQAQVPEKNAEPIGVFIRPIVERTARLMGFQEVLNGCETPEDRKGLIVSAACCGGLTSEEATLLIQAYQLETA